MPETLQARPYIGDPHPVVGRDPAPPWAMTRAGVGAGSRRVGGVVRVGLASGSESQFLSSPRSPEMAQRVRVREITNDEDNGLLRTLRRSSGRL